MSVATTTSKIQYTLTTGSQALSVPFYFLDNAHIKAVTVATETLPSITLVLGTDYTLIGAGNPAGGTLTTIATIGNGLAAGSKVVIKRNVPITQPTSYSPNDAFPAKVHEAALDRGIMIAQQSDEQSDRALRFLEDDSTAAELPPIADRANKALGFNATGGIEMKTVVGAGGILEDESVGESPLQGAFRSRAQASVALMKAQSYANAKQDDRVELLGYYAAGDGGDGLFYVDKDDTTTADNGGTVIVANDGTRLKRVSYCGPRGFGAKGDWNGSTGTDDTTAITSWIANAPNYTKIKFDNGWYRTTARIPITSKNIAIDASAASFYLAGNNTGFNLTGTSTYFNWNGGNFTGDGVNRDADTTKHLVAVLVGNNSGDTLSNVQVSFVTATLCNIGVEIADGRTGAADATHIVNNCKIIGCNVSRSIGVVGGCGYGIQIAQAWNTSIIGCVTDNCDRHGIYCSEGKNVTISDCHVINHRATITPGTVRGAMVVSRTSNVAVTNCQFRDNLDVSLVIDCDAQGLTGYNTAENVVVSNCVFKGSDINDIRIGTTAVPATDGIVTNVKISNCQTYAKASTTNSSIVINNGSNITIDNVDVNYAGAGVTCRAIALTGQGGQAYSKIITIKNSGIISAGYGIQIDSSILTGSQVITLQANKYTAATAPIEWVGGNGSITNTSVTSDDPTEYTISGATPVISYGVNFIVTNGGATDMTNMSGGYSGKSVSLFFTNSNTTVKATNFYLAGAVDFASTSNDILNMSYRNGAWRESGRSLN